MKEDFLHFIWKYRLFNQLNLKTSEGEPLEIINVGEHNQFNGPDFLNAQVKIGNETWTGSVEIHIHSSEWNKHKHQHDSAYNTVMLHVVLVNDAPTFNSSQNHIPILELQFRLYPNILQKYQGLMASKKVIPCGKAFETVPPLTRELWLDRMLIERLEVRTKDWIELAETTTNHLEHLFLIKLISAFGFGYNTKGFSTLAMKIPFLLFKRLRYDYEKLISLLLGLAGLLEPNESEGYTHRNSFFSDLKKLYLFQSMNKNEWKLSGIRPENFPQKRIKELAHFLNENEFYTDKWMNASAPEVIKEMFMSKSKEANSAGKRMFIGESSFQKLMINFSIPFYFYLSIRNGDESYRLKALEWYSFFPFENDAVTRKFYTQLDQVAKKTSAQSQAYHHLNKEYCSKFACLSCTIGHHVLSG